MKIALYPGSFDPITYGHMDIIEQSLKIFDKLIISVMVNNSKKAGLFSLEERCNLIKSLYSSNPNVKVIFNIEKVAAVNVATQNGCIAIIRGMRNITDFPSEKQMSDVNYTISKGKVLTVPLFAKPNKIDISSSVTKELFLLGVDIDNFVPEIVKNALVNKFREDF